MKIKYTKEVLTKLVSESLTVAEVLRKLGLKQSGGAHSHISKKIKEFKINNSHFLGSSFNTRLNYIHKKRTPDEILILRESGTRKVALQLRRALIEIEREYKCEICNLKDSWNNQEIRLEIDHKNNNWLDNRAENLRFLCPNCHSQQKHKMNKGHTGLISAAKYSRIRLRQKLGLPEDYIFTTKNVNLAKNKIKCLDCSKSISINAIRCKSCTTKLRGTKIVWPETVDLIKMVESSSYCGVARQLGVSDNAVRKRLKVHKNAI